MPDPDDRPLDPTDLRALDADRPFAPDEAFRAGVRRRGRHLRRRRRSLAGGAVLAPLVVLGIAAAWARGRLADVDRVELDVQGPAVVDGAPDGPVDLLVVGTDAGLFDDVAGHDGAARADALALVRLDPVADQVRVLSLPRDLWVGTDRADTTGQRLAAVRADGGPAALLEVADGMLVARGGDDGGVESYVELDADGLARLVDAAGGVDLIVWAAQLRDQASGLELTVDAPGGCAHLDGDDAVALARSRFLEVQEPDGSWTADPRSDLGRRERTAALGQVLATAVLDAHTTPGSLLGLLDVVGDHLTLDGATSVEELAVLASWARGLPQRAVQVRSLPVDEATTADGASVLRPAPDADDALRWLVDGRTMPAAWRDQPPVARSAAAGVFLLPVPGGCAS